MENMLYGLAVGVVLLIALVVFGGGMFFIKYIANGAAPDELTETETKIVCAMMVFTLIVVFLW